MGTGTISLPEIRRLPDKACKNVLCVASLEGKLDVIQNILQSRPKLLNTEISQVNACNLLRIIRY